MKRQPNCSLRWQHRLALLQIGGGANLELIESLQWIEEQKYLNTLSCITKSGRKFKFIIVNRWSEAAEKVGGPRFFREKTRSHTRTDFHCENRLGHIGSGLFHLFALLVSQETTAMASAWIAGKWAKPRSRCSIAGYHRAPPNPTVSDPVQVCGVFGSVWEVGLFELEWEAITLILIK